jgi:hypothetical protein
VSSQIANTRAISKGGELSYTKSLDIFDALGVKDVYAPKRKQGEREHQLHDQNAPNPRRVLCAPASDRHIAGLLPSRSVNEGFLKNVDIRAARILSASD